MAPGTRVAKRTLAINSTPKQTTKRPRTAKNKSALNMSAVQNAAFNFASSVNSNAVTVEVLKSLLSETVESVNKNVDQKFDNINESLLKQNQRIIDLEKEVLELKGSMSQITSENEYLWKEVLRPNLILVGVQDSEGEDKQKLIQSVSKLLNFNGSQVTFDCVFRIGNYSPGRNRPIKIKFYSVSDREFVFENRAKFKAPIFINEDLPRVTRRDHAVLRHAKKKMIAEGSDAKSVKINWVKKSILSGSSLFKIINGEVKFANNLTQRKKHLNSSPKQSSSQAGFLSMEQN